jgi:FtsZ-interacting cell division protein ZipA
VPAWTFVTIMVIALLAVVLDGVWRRRRRAPAAGDASESSPLPVPAPR